MDFKELYQRARNFLRGVLDENARLMGMAYGTYEKAPVTKTVDLQRSVSPSICDSVYDAPHFNDLPADGNVQLGGTTDAEGNLVSYI